MDKILLGMKIVLLLKWPKLVLIDRQTHAFSVELKTFLLHNLVVIQHFLSVCMVFVSDVSKYSQKHMYVATFVHFCKILFVSSFNFVLCTMAIVCLNCLYSKLPYKMVPNCFMTF